MKLSKQQQKAFKNQIRRIKFGKQITGVWSIIMIPCLALFALFIVFLICWTINCMIHGTICNTDDYMFSVLKIVYPSDKLIGQDDACNIGSYLIMGAVATLLVPLLTAAFSNLLEIYTRKIREGRRVYKLYNHYVFIGYNKYALRLVDKLLGQVGIDTYLIILTTISPESIRAELQNTLNKDVQNRVILYAGSPISRERVESLNISYAEKLFLFDESDAHSSQYTRNLSVLKNIVEASSMRIEPLEVYMQVNNSKAYNLLQRVDIPTSFFVSKKDGESQTIVDFRPFNFYENWARLLWSYHVLRNSDGTPKYEPLNYASLEDTNNHVHLVISEFNSMGRALLLEALRICHYLNFDELTGKNKTIISIFDSNWNNQKDEFYAQYPYVSEIADIQIDAHNVDVNSEEARKLLTQWAQDENKLLTIAICDKEADIAMTNALNLPEAVFYQANLDSDMLQNDKLPRVLIRQELDKSFDEILEKNSIAYPHVKFFGMLQNACEEALYDDYLAICANVVYADVSNKDENQESKKINILDQNVEAEFREKFRRAFTDGLAIERDKWRKLEESKKWSNRYQVDMYGYYLNMISTYQKKELAEIAQLYERLAQVEHRRWCAERIVAGWHQTENGMRDDARRIHDKILPYSEIAVKERNKDYNVIVTLSLLLQVAEEEKRRENQ